MLFTKAALCISSLILLAAAQEDLNAAFKGLTPRAGRGRTLNPTSTSKLMSRRDLEKRCTGSCAECFGAGYTLCPGSDIYCYLPGDATYGLDSCSSSSGSDDTSTTATASAPTSTSTGTAGAGDACNQTGATCTSCFGPGYLQCPDGYHCYDPTDPVYNTCPDDGSSSGGSSTGGNGGNTTTSSCAGTYGDGNIPCGSDSCYNPDAGESCCDGGYYCAAGSTCSSTVGECSPGSSSSGGGSLSDGSSTSSPAYTFATSTNGLIFSTDGLSTPTSTSSSSSSTGISQSADASDGKVLAVARGLLVAAGVGVLVL